MSFFTASARQSLDRASWSTMPAHQVDCGGQFTLSFILDDQKHSWKAGQHDVADHSSFGRIGRT